MTQGNPCANGAPHGPTAYKDILVNMSGMSIAFGVCLIFGSIISVLPQHHKIWKTRSSVGVSFLWLFLGNINQFAGALNAVVLKFPQERACFVVGFGLCMPSLLALIQLVGLWIFTFPIYIWCLKFIDHRNTTLRERKIALILFGVILVYFVVVSSIAAILIIFTGLLSTVVTFIQWSPQIYATFKRKSVGSFSILMLCIQVPGSALIVYFLIFKSHEEVTTWLSYVSSLAQQIVLLLLLVHYYFKNKPIVDMSINSQEKAALLTPTDLDGDDYKNENAKSLPSLI